MNGNNSREPTATVRSPLSQSMDLSMSGLGDNPSHLHGMAEDYRRAAKLFLNKQFAGALEQTQVILGQRSMASDKIYTKTLKLYFVLIDKALKGAAGVTSTTDPSVLEKLQRDTCDGSLWKMVQMEYGSLDAVPVDVAHGLVSLCVRNCVESKENANMVEQYLSGVAGRDAEDSTVNDDYMRIVDAYVMHILPARGEWEYAREVVEMSTLYDDEAKEQLVRKLGLLEQEEADRVRAEKAEKSRAEALRKQQEDEKKNYNSAAGGSVAGGSGSAGGALSPARTGSPISHPGSSASPSSSKQTDRNRQQQSIPQRGLAAVGNYWREKLIEYIRETPLHYMLIFVVVAASASNAALRTRILSLLRQLWAKFVEAARMGLKVSFI